MRQSANGSPVPRCQRTSGNIDTGSKHPGRLEKAVSHSCVSLQTCRPWVSCRPRATNIYSPEAHLGLSEMHGRRFGSEEGDKGKMMETEQRSRGRERGKAGTGDGNGEKPRPSGPPPALSSFSPQGLNSLGTMTLLKIFSPKKYACRCTCTTLPKIPGAFQTPPRNPTLPPPTTDLKLQTYHGTAFHGSNVETEKGKTQEGWEGRGAYTREGINIVMLLCRLTIKSLSSPLKSLLQEFIQIRRQIKS